MKFLWLGNDRENARMHSAVTKIRNDRDARNNFFDAAETVTQMIEFGYIRPSRDRPWFYPTVDEEHDEWISQYARERYLREIFIANRGVRQRAQSALEQRVQQYRTRRLTTISDEDLPVWEEAYQRELEALREHPVISPFQATDEQTRSSMRVVRGTRYSATGIPRRRTRVEQTGEYVPVEPESTGPSVSAINVLH